MRGLVALAVALTLCTSAHADPLRSRALRAGAQVDHREALICGGKDELQNLQNLQWLPVAEHREKTQVEVKLCRARGTYNNQGRTSCDTARAACAQRRTENTGPDAIVHPAKAGQAAETF